MNTYSAHLPAAPTVSLTEREARFAEHMAVFDDPAAAWQASGDVRTTKRLSMQRAAYALLARPHVRNRITELRNRMAEVGPQATRAALVFKFVLRTGRILRLDLRHHARGRVVLLKSATARIR